MTFKDILLGAGAAASVAWAAGFELPHYRPGSLHVAFGGTGLQTGTSPRHAFASIQKALDRAGPGDTIVIHSGVFHERIRVHTAGRAVAPIVIRAARPGSVTLTGAARAGTVESLVWRPGEEGSFWTVSPWRVFQVRYRGQQLFPALDLLTFREIVRHRDAFGTFAFAGDTLHVWLPEGGEPADSLLEMNGPVPEPLSGGNWHAYNIWVEASHVRIEGLRLDFGSGYGVRVFDGEDVHITDTWITGAATGIDASGGGSSAHLQVANSGFHNYPQGSWGKWLPWASAYVSTGHIKFLLSLADAVEVTGNLVVHAADPLQVSTLNVPIQSGAEVRENLLAYCADDAIEFDGFAKKIRFRENLVYDCLVSLGTSPVLTGPVLIEDNLFLHPAGGLNGAQIKLLSPSLNRPPPLNGPIQNVTIQNNTFVGNWLVWYGSPPTPTRNVRIFGNRFAIQRAVRPLWPAGVHEEGNDYTWLPESGYPNPGTDPRWLCVPRACAGGEMWSMSRPGPRWLDWQAQPATRQLLQDLEPGLIRH